MMTKQKTKTHPKMKTVKQMLSMRVKRHPKKQETFIVEMDGERLESLAKLFGWFRPEFIDAINEAEQEIEAGRVYPLKSFKDLDS